MFLKSAASAFQTHSTIFRALLDEPVTSAARDGCNPEDAASPPVTTATDTAAARRRNLARSIVAPCISPFVALAWDVRLRCSLRTCEHTKRGKLSLLQYNSTERKAR